MNMMLPISNNNEELSEDRIDQNPFRQFFRWLEERPETVSEEKYAAALGTSDKEGRVSVREVLVRDIDDDGFTFFTNYKSRKAGQIDENPFGALLFYWPEMYRQVRIEGRIGRVPEASSTGYFNNRPRGNQISAWVSEQSQTIPDRKFLETRFSWYKDQFDNRPVPKPPEWGGYKLNPDWFEFWQGRSDRLHDRIVYSASGDKWIITRLAP
jgi:pyridoxamine 5'-phosphate oxidase